MKITAVILALIAAVSAASVEQKSVAHYTYEDIREQELKCKADRNREWKYDAATNTCAIDGMCGLKHVLKRAQNSFLDTLGNYHLSDFLQNQQLVVFARG